MRVGIDARLVYYSQAGIGQYILHLVEGLAKVDQDNEYVLLQSRKDSTTILEDPNFRRVSLWTPTSGGHGIANRRFPNQGCREI